MSAAHIARDDEAFFKDISWCSKLLDNDRFVIQHTANIDAVDPSAISFMAKTLNTSETIRHWVTLNCHPDTDLDPAIQETITLLDIGSGVNGYVNICHGGFVAALLDEGCGTLLSCNHDYEVKAGRVNAKYSTQLTASLTVNYRRAVPTPSVLVLKAKITKAKGKKWWVAATLEDDKGIVLADAQALFVTPRIGYTPRL